ncbi:MAG TPA: cation-translocating P-type ATPase, partial [Lachnospiraceae bacterium]
MSKKISFTFRKKGLGLTEEKNKQVRKTNITRFMADPRTGLSQSQVNIRKKEGYTNAPVDPPSKTTQEIIKSNVFTYFNLIFVIIAILLILVGSFRDLTFLPIIIANTLIGIIQEIRSKKVLDDLSVLNSPKAHVLRDGKVSTIPAEELVLDDIVVFTAGTQIPADATVIGGIVQVNESLITGESDEITKEKNASLLSGSFIVSGKCLARIEKVGEDSYVSKLTLEAKQAKEGEQSEMIRSLNRLVKAVGILIIPIGIVLFTESMIFSDASVRTGVVSMVAAIIGMIPEGLYLLASVALVVSVMRLARDKVLVHEMACIETLARVDTLCVDKTGTITENTMETNAMIRLHSDTYTIPENLEILLGDFVSNMSKDNITMAALQDFFKEVSKQKASNVTPFSSATKYSSLSFSDKTYVLGAPEFVLRDQYQIWQKEIEKYSSEGYRVLVFGHYHGQVTATKPLTERVDAYALLLLSNPIRKEAPETFEYFENQGVEIKVISGDNPITVSKVAQKAGISNAQNYVDASNLKTAEDIEEAVLRYTVFGRVTPNQKRQFVSALKKSGRVVAMTGDGVNDVLALKDADCSIAMASGSDAAAQASQLVLLESDFSKMPSVVLEGRRVVNNIERSSSLFLVKNLFSFLMALFSMFTLTNYPLSPSQVSMISMFTIGIPAFLLSMEPNKNMIRGRFLTNVLLQALPAGLTNFIVVSAMVIFGNVFGVESNDVSTASTLLLAIVGFMILFRISKPMNMIRWTIWGTMLFGMLFSIFFAKELFNISHISLKGGMLLAVFSLLTEPIFRYTTLLVEKGQVFAHFFYEKWQQ